MIEPLLSSILEMREVQEILSDLLRIEESDLFAHLSIPSHRASCIVPRRIVGEKLKEKERKEIFNNREDRIKLKNTLKGLSQYLLCVQEKKFDVSIALEDLWHYKEVDQLVPPIKFIKMSDYSTLPFIFSSSNNWYMIAPQIPTWNNDAEELDENNIKEDLLPDWLRSKLVEGELRRSVK